MADFIKNAWYVAAWISDLEDKPIHRKIISQHIALYRDSAGAVVALADMCPHRFAPLHQGKIVGDALECPYHGLRFDKSGSCVYNHFNNGTDGIPPNTRVQTYPVVERYRFIWVWLGDPELADEKDIPDYSFLDVPEGFAATGETTLEMPVNYQLILDNLMDLSHAQFLHPTTVGNSAMSGGTIETRMEDGYVYCDRMNPNGEVPNLFSATDLVPEGGRVDFWNDMWWAPASCYYLEVGITPTGRSREEGIFVKSAQALTPIDETTTAYRFILYRNFLQDNHEVTAGMEAVAQQAFCEEDEPMISAVQGYMDGRDFWELRPVILESDRAGIMVRRSIEKLAKQNREKV